MFNFLNPNYWCHQASGTLVTDMVHLVQKLPERLNDEFERHGTTPAAVLDAAAAQGAQALCATANFAVTATGSLLGMAWNGLATYVPPLAQGLWNGVTTYGPPLAQEVWTGLKTYGPPTAMALGKATVWAGTNAWEAAKWGGNALAVAAEEHHVKERAIAAGQEVLGSATKGLVALAHAGWERLHGNEASPSPEQHAESAALGDSEVLAPAARAGDSPEHDMLDAVEAPGEALPPVVPPLPELIEDAVLPIAQMTASLPREMAGDSLQLPPDSQDPKQELHSSVDPTALQQGGSEMAKSVAPFETWQITHGTFDAPGHNETQGFESVQILIIGVSTHSSEIQLQW